MKYSLFLITLSIGLMIWVTHVHSSELLMLGYGTPHGVSDNGGVIVGERTCDPELRRGDPSQAWRWTRENDQSALNPLSQSDAVLAWGGLSADGTIVGGRSGTLATRWTSNDDPLSLGPGIVLGVSADGIVLVGGGQDDESPAFRWSSDRGREPLPPSSGYEGGSAQGVSADGTVIVGYSGPRIPESEATVWKEQDGETKSIGLGRYFGQNTWAWLVSRDGSTVVGGIGEGFTGQLAQATEEPFRWTESTGLVPLGGLNGQGATATAISADASIIVGNTGTYYDFFVWDQAHGMRDLRTVLEQEHGIDTGTLSRESLPLITGMSADARTIVGRIGECDSPRGREAWALFLDRPLVVTTGVLGDFNGSADLDIEDLDLLAAELRSGRNVDLFDVNQDKMVDFEDRRSWVHDLARTYFGDANLDGQFTSNDLVAVLQAGQYEDAVALNSKWSDGDWNGDGDFTSGDLVLALQDGGYELDPRAAVNGVPEPASIDMLMIGVIATCVFSRSRQILV